MIRTTALFTLAACVALGACGSSPEQEAIEALEQQAQDIGADAGALEDLTDEEIECLESEVGDVDLVGLLSDATSAGVEQRVELTNGLITCAGPLDEDEAFVEEITATFNAALGGNADLDTTEGGCILGHVLDESADPGRALADGSDEADQAIFVAALEACADQTTMDVVSGVSGPMEYGDDARLDSLYDDCEAGDDRACDILYIASTVDSDYERLAVDCAGRGDGTDVCTSGLDLSLSGDIDPSSPAFPRLESECEAGDMTACDLLYRVAPLGSDLEQFGFTCGGRIVAGGLPDCRTRFPDLATEASTDG